MLPSSFYAINNTGVNASGRPYNEAGIRYNIVEMYRPRHMVVDDHRVPQRISNSILQREAHMTQVLYEASEGGVSYSNVLAALRAHDNVREQRQVALQYSYMTWIKNSSLYAPDLMGTQYRVSGYYGNGTMLTDAITSGFIYSLIAQSGIFDRAAGPQRDVEVAVYNAPVPAGDQDGIVAAVAEEEKEDAEAAHVFMSHLVYFNRGERIIEREPEIDDDEEGEEEQEEMEEEEDEVVVAAEPVVHNVAPAAPGGI